MDRRKFAGVVAGAGIAAVTAEAQQAERRARFFTMDSWQIKAGDQATKMADWLGNNLAPALGKLNASPVLILDAVFAPRVPNILMFAGYSSFAEIETVQNKIAADATLKAAWEKIEGNQTAGPGPYEAHVSSILETVDYSPATATKSDKPRYYEMRVYHASTEWQLRAIHERFTTATMRLFKAHGIEPSFMTTMKFGPNMPNLTYLIPWDTLAAREKAWDAFNADPDWVKARKDSIDKGGQIVINSEVGIYKATAYSPTK